MNNPEAESTAPAFDGVRAQIERYRPADLAAPNHNDLRSFLHAWFANFDHIGPVEFFLDHLDDGDMTFDSDGQPIATDHTSFRAWYATVPAIFPWDFHSVIGDVVIAGTVDTGWSVQFFFRHVGEYHDVPIGRPGAGEGRLFNRVLRADWRVEHRDGRFVIKRYALATADAPLPI